jgi:hypothetical protein
MAADLSIIIKAVDQASGTINGVQRELGGLEKGAGRLGGILKGGLMVGAGVAVAGIGALGAVLGSSVKAASEAEDIQAQLEAVLKSTGGAAGMTAEAINEHALALSEMTRFEDDSIVAASALMLTFTKVGSDVFPQATEATLNMAQAMGMDLNSATMLVGKALNDPVKGMTALTRAGIQFTESQKETIASMVAMGDTAGAQQIILKELEVQFGGSAKAAGETFGGQLDIMKNALGNVGEEIGGALLPALTEMAIKMGPGLIEGAKKFADWAVSDLIPALIRIGEWLEVNVPKAIAALKQAWIEFQPTAEVIKGIFKAIGDVLEVVWKWLEVNVPKAIEATRQAIIDAQPTIEIIKGIFEDVGEVLGVVWDWLSEKIPSAVAAVKGAFEDAKNAISGVIGVIQGVIDTIATALDKLNEFLGRSASIGGGSMGGAGVTGPTRPGMGGTGAGSTPGPPGMGGVKSASGANSFGFNITINAAGGNPQTVAVAAQQGVMAAARSMGLA